MEKRGKGSSLSVQGKQEGFTSKGVDFVCTAQGDDMEEGWGHYQGALSPRVIRAHLFRQPFLGFRSRAGPRGDQSGTAAKHELFGLARHLS